MKGAERQMSAGQSADHHNAEVGPFLRKLRHGVRMTAEDEAVLADLSRPARHLERGDILQEGERLQFVALVIEGWVCHYKQLENGKRQITAIHVPGDLCEPFGSSPRVIDYTLAALTPACLTFVPSQKLLGAGRSSPRIEKALWWDLTLSEAFGRQHIASLGRRSATERLSYFLCEMHSRLEMVGLVDDASYDFPLTQTDLADFCGLSAVHVNRSLQELRGSNLLSLRDRRATLHDVAALRELAMFDPIDVPPIDGARV